MKRFATGLCLAFLVCMATTALAYADQSIQLSDSPNGVRLLDQNNDGLTLKLEIGTVDFINVMTKEGAFNLMSVSGLARSHRVGEPNLPMSNKLISIPYGCALEVEVISSDVEEISLTDLGLTDPIIPAQPPLCKSDDPASIPFEYDRQVYQTGGYYRLPLAETRIAGMMRALRLGMVSIAPVEYNPTENKVRIYKELTVRVTFEHPDWATTEANWTKYYSPYFEPIYDRIINHVSFASSEHPDLVKYPVTYVIVSDRMFEAQLQPFIEWKTKKGFKVFTAYTDVIGASTTAIKGYIQNLYQTEEPPPSFVLLVGDVGEIPSFSGSAGGHITDLRFCEFSTPADHFPEIYYGRFSAQNTGQLQPQIDKTLEYEQYLMPDPSYLEEVTLVSGYDSYGHDLTHGNGQINYGTNLYFNSAHGIDPNVWLSPASSQGTAPADIRQTISDGVGFYNYTAHCSHYGHGNPSFTTSHIPSITDNHKYLLGIGNCCEANTFGESGSPCFGEAFLQVAEKGGIGYIGGSNGTYWDEDYWWGVGYGPVIGNGPTYEQTGPGAYDGIFHDHGEPVDQHYITNDAIIFAGNLGVTESGSSRETYYWEIYHLMGDPSVFTYMGVPSTNNVVHDATILMTATSITVLADPASYVGITVDGELQGAGYVDASGSVDIDLVGFDSPCMVDIVITGQNRIPYVSTIQVIAPSGPYVIFDYYVIDDAAGNGNGLVDNGESIVLGMGLINVGPDDAYNVEATISTTDAYVTISDGTESYGIITGNNGTGYSVNAFAFDVAANTPDRHQITFDLEVTGTERDTWVGTFRVTVHTPAIEFVSIVIDDATGDGNGVLDPGETAELVVTLNNTGSGQAFTVEAYLFENDQYITVGDDYSYFGDIDSINGTADNSLDIYEVSADGECPLGYAVPIELQLSAGGGYSISLFFNVTVGDRAVFYFDDFSYDQGWNGLGGSAEWTMGSPSGGGGDPSADHTPTSDNYVLGNDLTTSGTYNNGIGSTQWASSSIIDCGNMSDVIMTYYHWLGVESSTCDHAYLEVFDGSSWVRLYENGSTLQESEWIEEVYDLSAVADSNPDFQIRFGLGPTDGSQTYSGWNIDDIELKGYGRVGVPELQIVEAELSDSLQPDGQSEKSVTVKNTGEGTLRVWFTSNNDWLVFSGDQQVIAPADSTVFPVTIDAAGLLGGDHVGSLDFTSNDNGNPQGSIPVFLHVYAPDIYIAETSLNKQLETGEQSIYPLVITNNGPGRLDFQVNCQMYRNDKAGGGLVAGTQAAADPEPLGYRPADADKSDAVEPYFSPMKFDFGGPDTYGHSWVDSDEPNGPVFEWVDISGIGTEITTFGDDTFEPIQFGFGFPLYDSVYTEACLGSNGLIVFDSCGASRINTELPNQDIHNAIVAMWWDDIDPRKGGHIYYYHDAANGQFIISFVEVKLYYSTTGTGSLTFQVILREDGTMKLQYGTMDPGQLTFESGTIGIQNSEGSDGLQILFNAPYMHDNLAIEITAEHWLSAVPAGGSIDPFGNTTIDVKFDATDLEDGNYSGQVVISSNDPDTPSWPIPAGLTVGTGGDVTPPVISDIAVSNVGTDSATISWTTDEPATSQIEYGLTTGYGLATTLDPTLTISHSQTIKDLADGTEYHFTVKSADEATNEAVSDDSTFTTLPDYICGDIDGDGSEPDIADLVYLVTYMFQFGPPPPVMEAADVDGEPGITIADVIYLVQFMFNDGPPLICGQ